MDYLAALAMQATMCGSIDHAHVAPGLQLSLVVGHQPLMQLLDNRVSAVRCACQLLQHF